MLTRHAAQQFGALPVVDTKLYGNNVSDIVVLDTAPEHCNWKYSA